MKPKQLTLSNSEKLGMISNLATMLAAGIPILEVINSLLEDARGNTKKILETLHDDLIAGKRVSASFATFPRVFDAVTISVLKASEEAGTLDIVLKDLRKNLQKEIEFSDKIKAALIYPIFILLVFAAVLLMILVVVIPKISLVFSRLRTQLPLPTRILIFASDILLHDTVFIIAGLSVIIVGGIFLYRSRRDTMLDTLFSLPLISNLIKEIDLTRFSRSLYLLLSSGLPIVTALEFTADVVIKRKTRQIILTSREKVLAGKKLSEGFREAKGYFPTIMIKLMESGEKTGTLDRSMQDISEYFDYQVSNTLKTVTSLLEPIMLVIVGGVIGALMLAIIAPIYGLIGQVGAR